MPHPSPALSGDEQAGAHRLLDASGPCSSTAAVRVLWPTLKPCIEEFWKNGHQTLFYAEGRWKHHLDRFRELPDRSIVFHCDQDDIFEVHRKLHDKFAISGGIPNVMLSWGQPQEVREFVLRVIKEVAKDGGYIMDAGRHAGRPASRT
jgi:hypothetical protein